MLPNRAYDPLPPSAGTRAEPLPTDSRPGLVVAVAPSDVDRFPSGPFVRFAARSTAEALRLMERWRPRVIAVDWDLADFDGKQICEAAKAHSGTGILVTMTAPDGAPAALRSGCHAVLLKPLTPNLIAARLGRLSRELPTAAAASRIAEKLGQSGTNRIWPEVSCPKCAETNAVSFEYSSHRRTWFACMSCESVWLARRQE